MHSLQHPAIRGTLLIGCLILTTSCQKAETRYAATLDRAALMLLPFPTWQASGPSLVQPVDLSATANDKHNTQPDAKRAEVSPIYVVKLDDTHATMVTDTRPIAEDDKRPYTCHSCPGIIGAYFFEHDANGWRMTARQDAAIQSGVEGNIGTTSVAKLADGHYALASEWGSCWQGYCGTWLVVLGLKPGKATPLSHGIPMSADNDGAHGACSALDTPPTEPEDKYECFDVHGKWKFQQGRLLVNFDGRLSKLNGLNQLFPTEKIRQQTVYEVVKDSLELVRGNNPVPNF